jgi:hypothetical protein
LAIDPNDFLQDVVGLCHTGEGDWVFAVPGDVLMNDGGEFRDDGKDAAAHLLVRGVTEDPIHPVHPGRKIGSRWGVGSGTGIKKFYDLEAI